VNPWVLNGIATLVGLAGWGIWGGIVAFAIAWSVSMLFGLACIWFSGGVLPRSVRRKAAESFLEAHRETAIAAYPELNDQALQNAIENKIEDICRAAPDQEYEQVMAAAQRLEKEEINPLRRSLITAIRMHLERTWWPQGLTLPMT
jgi:hypothetical protein